ncbi:Uncharacterized protein DBV15_01670, partial [Temnothorax longispinosus]
SHRALYALSGEKGYPSTCVASLSIKRRDEIPRKLEKMVLLLEPVPLSGSENDDRESRRAPLIARFNDVEPLWTLRRSFLSLCPGTGTRVTAMLPPAITGNIFVCPSRPRGGLRGTVIVGNDRADLNPSRSPFVTIIKTYATAIVIAPSTPFLVETSIQISIVDSERLCESDLRNSIRISRDRNEKGV